MRAHVRFVGLLMVVVLLAAIVAAAGPVAYIVTLDDQGNSYYLESKGDGTLEPQEFIGNIPTTSNYGAGMGYFTTDGPNSDYYDFVVGTGYAGGPPQEIYLYEKKNSGNAFIGPSKIGDWSSGSYPGDMPVATFNGTVFDPNALDDFVMIRYGTQDVGVYLNNGDGTFDQSEIVNAAPAISYGADTADIDHDGNADFVVAAAGGDPRIYVNLGNGDGTFRPQDFPTHWSVPYWGITAADFDGDYKVDLIATSSIYSSNANGFDFYKGDGLGNFAFEKSFGEGSIYATSAVDNYDLDGDNDQDLVVSYPSNDPYAVIVGTNYDGLGNFTFSDSITGDLTGARYTIAAPPVFQNEAPIAVVTVLDNGITINPDVQRIKAGTTLKFSHISSYDPEEKPLASEMIWWFEDDGSTVTTTEETVTHQFTKLGPNGVDLTVTDNYGATATQTVTIHVNYPPIAENDTYTTPKNNALTIAEPGVLANDHDSPDDDPLMATLVGTGTSHGTLTLNADGSFAYTPVKDFVGTDTFTYKANDGVEDSDVATVTIGVTETPVWKVNIVPNVINLNSKGVFIAFITIPKPFNANDVQADSVECEGAQAIRINGVPAIRMIRHKKFPQVFGAVFKTSDLQDVKTGKHVKLTVKGKVLYNNELLDISGTDTVRVLTTKNRIKDDTEDYHKQNDKQLFEKFPGYREYSKDWDSSGHEDSDQGHDH